MTELHKVKLEEKSCLSIQKTLRSVSRDKGIINNFMNTFIPKLFKNISIFYSF